MRIHRLCIVNAQKDFIQGKQKNPLFSCVTYGRASFAGEFRTNAMTRLNHAASLHRHEPFMLSCYSDDVAK